MSGTIRFALGPGGRNVQTIAVLGGRLEAKPGFVSVRYPVVMFWQAMYVYGIEPRIEIVSQGPLSMTLDIPEDLILSRTSNPHKEEA